MKKELLKLLVDLEGLASNCNAHRWRQIAKVEIAKSIALLEAQPDDLKQITEADFQAGEFETALEIVKKRMIEACHQIEAKGNPYSDVRFGVTRCMGKNIFEWIVYGDNSKHFRSDHLDEAMTQIISNHQKTPLEIAQEEFNAASKKLSELNREIESRIDGQSKTLAGGAQ